MLDAKGFEELLDGADSGSRRSLHGVHPAIRLIPPTDGAVLEKVRRFLQRALGLVRQLARRPRPAIGRSAKGWTGTWATTRTTTVPALVSRIRLPSIGLGPVRSSLPRTATDTVAARGTG